MDMTTRFRSTLAAVVLGMTCGCLVAPVPVAKDADADADAQQTKTLKQVPAPPKPPPVPPAMAMPVDGELRERAKNEIINASRSADPVIRANAIEAAQDGLGGGEGATIVLGGLKDGRPLARFAAAMAAGTLRLEPARPLLLGLADDPDEIVRIGARYALHKLGDHRRTKELEQTAVSQRPRVRATTAMVLGLLGEPSGLKVLRYMRKDPDANVRLQVAEAMWRLGDEQGFETLVAVSIGQYPDDQMIAILAMARGQNPAAAKPYLRGKLTTPYTPVNLVAARAMGIIGSDEGYTIATQSAGSQDARERHLAALALGAIGRSDAQTTLSRLLTDAEPAVRLAAAVAILQLRETGQNG
jgi:HEAT repeat protein